MELLVLIFLCTLASRLFVIVQLNAQQQRANWQKAWVTLQLAHWPNSIEDAKRYKRSETL